MPARSVRLVASTLLALAGLGPLTAASAVADDLPPLTASSTSALFTARKVVPGQVMSACTTLSWNRDAPARLSLQPRSSGALAEMVVVRVERLEGTSCTSAARGTLYSGTLAALSGPPGSSRAMASFESNGRATFRFTVQLIDTDLAQGASAAADFVWRIDSDVDIDVPPTETPVPPVTGGGGNPPVPDPTVAPPVTGVGGGGTTPGGGGDSGTGTTPGDPPAGVPTSSPSTGVPGSAGSGGDAVLDDGTAGEPVVNAPLVPEDTDPDGEVIIPGFGGRSGAGGGSPDAVANGQGGPVAPLMAALKRVGEVSVQVGQRAAPPFVILGIVLVFLAVQRRLDAGDPKLSSALVYAPPKLVFTRHGGQRAANAPLRPTLRQLFALWRQP